jgi:hypothetical protein
MCHKVINAEKTRKKTVISFHFSMGKKDKRIKNSQLLPEDALGLAMSRVSSLSAASQTSIISTDPEDDNNDNKHYILKFIQDIDSKRQSTRLNALTQTINLLSFTFYNQLTDTADEIISLLFKCVRREETEAVLAVKLITIIYITIGKSTSFEKICQILQSDLKSLPDKLKSISLISLSLISIIEDFNLQIMPLILSILENEESTDEVVLSALCSLGLIYSFETIG